MPTIPVSSTSMLLPHVSRRASSPIMLHERGFLRLDGRFSLQNLAWNISHSMSVPTQSGHDPHAASKFGFESRSEWGRKWCLTVIG
jgi:hypothetical protein